MTSGAEDDEDPLKEARAYNNSILFMVTVPYVILGTGGFLVYRGLNRAKLQAAKATAHP
jgi:hypothetical protein